jgi:phospholipase/carboxylesterase
MDELETLEIETGPQPVAAVIWLHGLGADAHDFEPVVPILNLGPDRPMRFIFPNAPVQPVTINGGMSMRSWYDILGLEAGSREDVAGVRAIAGPIAALLDREQQRGLSADRILLAGFSQGGAMALYTGLRYPSPLAGILALSCYLPDAASLEAELPAANRAVPIFMAHGNADPVVAPSLGQKSFQQLLAAGCEVSWKSYPMPHSVIPEELADIRQFLDAQVRPLAAR